jgi:type II secretory ATPase GspE/PulE/Tfp pilus assembly ATPase PilB-like protein/putative methionine-R-sulfoxide reductase with GAF domain
MLRNTDTSVRSKAPKLRQVKDDEKQTPGASKGNVTRLKTADAVQQRQPRPEMQFKIRLQKIASKIYGSKNQNEIFIAIIDEIVDLFECDRMTIYVLDGERRELISRYKTGNEIKEIRIKVSAESIAGYAAHKQKVVNISNVYDDKELAAIDPNLRFDKTWDTKSGFTTQQVLAVPVFFQRYLMGAIQLINRKADGPFSKVDEKAAQELAKIIGIGLHNLKKTQRQSNNKFTYLLQKHLISPKDLKKAHDEAGRMRDSVENVLMKQFSVPKKEIVESLAKYHGAPAVEYSDVTPIPKNLIKGLKVPFMRNNLWVPLRAEGDKIVIAIDDPQNFQKIGGIKSVFPNNPLEFVVATKEDILDFITLFTEEKKQKKEPTDFDIDAISDELMKGVDVDVDQEEEEELVSEESSAVVKLVNKIIIDSFHQNVSDIHIEPQPGKADVKIRTRIDGACQIYPMPIPYSYRNAIASRIKIMSGLDIAERRKPQDGKIPFKKYGGLNIELRVATVPTQGGMEDIVMRILAAGEPIPFDNLGFSDWNKKRFLEIIQQPYGIIFVCGPTGSGKTTTLHSALKVINTVDRKIWTAEDPVEITQKGLRQVQMHPKIGLNFAAAMRSFLRADPDVIMVGEMRDKETTAIGIEASLTGHLVFSTLHTNSAPESITRLLDMGMDPFNFADALLGILAQRLVRTLCKDCKQPYTPDQEEYDAIVREYGEKMFREDFNLDRKEMTLYRAEGCEKCRNTGYKGRMGIHELLLGSDEIKKLVQTQARVKDIQEQAIGEGMRVLKQDGVAKVIKGFTDMAQVKKVCIA